jgi:hypothetical protein
MLRCWMAAALLAHQSGGTTSLHKQSSMWKCRQQPGTCTCDMGVNLSGQNTSNRQQTVVNAWLAAQA